MNRDCLFILARAIKAFEITHDRRLPPTELKVAFSTWWSAAKPHLPPDAEFDEWRFDFEATFAKTHAALGANSLEEAILRTDANPMPPQAIRYTSPKLRRLVAVCYHLQSLQVSSPFFLGVRDAARIGGANGLTQASAWLAGLVRDGILTEIEKGTRKRATRFRFNLPESAPVGNPATPAKSVCPDTPAQPQPTGVTFRSKPANPVSLRKLSTYDLAERKKALQDLINGLGGSDFWGADERKRYLQLSKELEQVNIQLAGITG